MSSSVIAYYQELYERTLAEHGATNKGVLEPRQGDLDIRLGVMSELWAKEPRPLTMSLLDLGCGYGAFLDYFNSRPEYEKLDYHGIDITGNMIEAGRKRHPGAKFEQRDIIADPLPQQSVDYVVVKSVLTAKFDISNEDMITFAKALLASAFDTCRKGLVFNVQNWHMPRRKDLFHWPFDEVAEFLHTCCSPHYVMRADYGLYDYTVYVYRKPVRIASAPGVGVHA